LDTSHYAKNTPSGNWLFLLVLISIYSMTIAETTTSPGQEGPGGPGAGYITQGFPAPGLRRTVRHITGFDGEGNSIFLSTDCGDHHRLMGDSQAIANILYSTAETPVDLNGDADIQHAKQKTFKRLRPSCDSRVR
jgi:hypothetical protein